MIGHLSDAERVVSYRLLRIARGDKTPLPGFDEDAIAAASNADRRELADLVGELSVVRQSTLALVKSLDETVPVAAWHGQQLVAHRAWHRVHHRRPFRASRERPAGALWHHVVMT